MLLVFDIPPSLPLCSDSLSLFLSLSLSLSLSLTHFVHQDFLVLPLANMHLSFFPLMLNTWDAAP